MLRYLPILGCVIMLTGCTDDTQDLQAWINQIKTKTVPKNVNIPPLKEYISQPYTAANMVSPFSVTRVGSAVLEAPPDGVRPKEPLESIPLESMIFIGMIKQDKVTKGMLKIDGKIHQVALGYHIGQNYGKIIGIKEDSLTVKELIKDGENKWIDKIVTLPLQQEAAK
jgi:type IV pilus assembly protein PilP